jgi:hypothetical protein
MAGAANSSVYSLPEDTVDMEVSAAIPINNLLATTLSGRHHRKVAHILGQLLEILTCDSATQ